MSSILFRNRLFATILAVICLVTMIAPEAEAAKRKRHSVHRGRAVAAGGTNDARYADFVLNPTTGEVYHQQNADEKRYPASLTKMMTLYMLFEALEQRKTSLDARMDVSDYAATMPQTNLSLTPGESIPVETAIKALVVRSANDVAVVVAEALGGNVNTFGEMMTNKARQLGMKNTVFKNPNGLPNSGQYTTARDMAKLGIALKRDFPKYYPYFSTLQFSYDGVTYYTHNRVMLRYAGVDGIKTGFTGAAGFNLVTSAVRGGRPIVGVVLGGGSGGWRDNRMIQLLDQSYAIVASRGAAKSKPNPANLPLTKFGKKAVGIAPTAITDDVATVPKATLPDAPETEDGDASDVLPPASLPQDTATAQVGGTAAITTAASPFAAVIDPAQPPTTPSAPVTAPVVKAATAPTAKPAPAKPVAKPAPAPVPRVVTPTRAQVVMAPAAPAPVAQPSPFAYATAPVSTTVPAATAVPTPAVQSAPSSATAPVQLANPPSLSGDRGWGIQVGAFSTHALAEQAARNAEQTAAVPLKTATISVVGPAASGASVHRARLENLSQIQARKACELLISNNSPCFIYKSSDVR